MRFSPHVPGSKISWPLWGMNHTHRGTTENRYCPYARVLRSIRVEKIKQAHTARPKIHDRQLPSSFFFLPLHLLFSEILDATCDYTHGVFIRKLVSYRVSCRVPRNLNKIFEYLFMLLHFNIFNISSARSVKIFDKNKCVSVHFDLYM